MGTKSEYIKNATDTCLSVLIELMTILGAYREYIAIVGGWVPYFLLEHAREQHTGSLDIDIVLDFNKITEEHYSKIIDLLEKEGYKQKSPNTLSSFIKKVDEEFSVQLDLLAGEYGGTMKRHRHQNIQDIKARKARGGDLVFDHYISVKLSGKMPDGSENIVTIKVADFIPFLVMKGMAIWERKNPKDAYDIYFVVKNYKEGLKKLADEFKPFLFNKLIQEGLGKIRAKFISIDMIGPKWAADFEEIEVEEERAIIQRDAYERVNEFLNELNIEEFSEQ